MAQLRHYSIRRTPDLERRITLHCLETRFNQGDKWKALISKYIGTIPVSGDESCTAEQSMSGMLPPWILVSSAIIAKLGAAARDSQQSRLTLNRC